MTIRAGSGGSKPTTRRYSTYTPRSSSTGSGPTSGNTLGVPIQGTDGRVRNSIGTGRRTAGTVGSLDGFGGVLERPNTPGLGDNSQPLPNNNPGGGGPGGGGGGGGAGGGMSAASIAAAIAALNNYVPQKYQFQDYKFTPYDAQPYYEFDDSMYTGLLGRLDEAMAADLASGNAAIDEGIAQISNTPIAYSDFQYARDPGMSSAMERMLGAQGVDIGINQRTLNEGVQADDAMGRVGSLLNMAAQQKRQSDLMAMEGDRRQMTENIRSLNLGLSAGVEMAMANALAQYKKDKWAYGEEVARMNWQQNMQVGMYNNQGRNQAAQTNTQMVNEANASARDALLELAMSGARVDPNAYRQRV